MKTCRVHLRLAWWLRYYLGAVVICSWVTGLEPDREKLDAWIKRGIVLYVKDA